VIARKLGFYSSLASVSGVLEENPILHSSDILTLIQLLFELPTLEEKPRFDAILTVFLHFIRN
jgi:hypothetical protein